MLEFIQNNYQFFIAGFVILVALIVFFAKFAVMNPDEKKETVEEILEQLKTSIFSLVVSLLKNQDLDVSFDNLKTWIYMQLPSLLTSYFTEDEINSYIDEAVTLMLNKIAKTNGLSNLDNITEEDTVSKINSYEVADVELFEYIYNSLDEMQ
jgi:ABC-type uncharacterized transport system fused permease/ATPase subunit